MSKCPPVDKELEIAAEGAFKMFGSVASLTDEEFMNFIGNGGAVPDELLSHDGMVNLRRTSIPCASGKEQLPVLIATPTGQSGPFTCIYYTANGGKMYQGEAAGIMPSDTAWVAKYGIVLISVSPRVGPKHAHPAQVEDGYEGLKWICGHADELGVDASKIIIMGKSGGGGIAASVALYARDHGGPDLAGQILIYPMLDDRTVTISSRYDEARGWNPHSNEIGWKSILGDKVGGDSVDAYAAAARATDLHGLPPAYIEVGSSEIFRDEDLHYGMRLAEAGVPVEIHSWMGGFHGFEIVVPDVELSRACLKARSSFVARILRSLET